MTLLKGKIQQGTAVSRETEGTEKAVRLTSDGAVVTMDWKQAMVEEGRAFACVVGSFVTPATGGGQGTIIDQDQPEFCLNIPDGVSVWPKRVQISVLPPAIAADRDESECLIAIDKTSAVNAGTAGTATAETIYNLNTNHSRASSCTAKSVYTVNTGSAALDIELAHMVRIAEIDTVGVGTGWHENLVGFEMLYEPDAAPKINGPAKLLVYWGGTVATLAYACIEWYELPEGA